MDIKQLIATTPQLNHQLIKVIFSAGAVPLIQRLSIPMIAQKTGRSIDDIAQLVKCAPISAPDIILIGTLCELEMLDFNLLFDELLKSQPKIASTFSGKESNLRKAISEYYSQLTVLNLDLDDNATLELKGEF